MTLLPRLTAIFVLLLCLAACSKNTGPHAHGHQHAAPHGGTLVELGDHAYNLEFVHDLAAGKLQIYVLDGHAENFIRIALPAFDGEALVGEERRPLRFTAVANIATGETVGATSLFEAQAEWLKTTPDYDVAIPRLEIRGSAFSNIAAHIHGGGHHH